jgi:hypothetical protein
MMYLSQGDDSQAALGKGLRGDMGSGSKIVQVATFITIALVDLCA